MQYYFIYSAGGGAGDWNGIKRVWKSDMPEKLKSKILLKFGDIYFNHKSAENLIRERRWQSITDIRHWLFENVDDEYVLDKSEILLDSGTAKIVSLIEHKYNTGDLDTEKIIQYFKKIVDDNKIIEKYAEVIIDSKIDLAVCFDVPDPFKVRSDNEQVDRRRNILEADKIYELMDVAVEYTNKLYNILKEKIGEVKARELLMPVANGKWNKEQFETFLGKLEFEPKNIAVGAISDRGEHIEELELDKFRIRKI